MSLPRPTTPTVCALAAIALWTLDGEPLWAALGALALWVLAHAPTPPTVAPAPHGLARLAPTAVRLWGRGWKSALAALGVSLLPGALLVGAFGAAIWAVSAQQPTAFAGGALGGAFLALPLVTIPPLVAFCSAADAPPTLRATLRHTARRARPLVLSFLGPWIGGAAAASALFVAAPHPSHWRTPQGLAIFGAFGVALAWLHARFAAPVHAVIARTDLPFEAAWRHGHPLGRANGRLYTVASLVPAAVFVASLPLDLRRDLQLTVLPGAAVQRLTLLILGVGTAAAVLLYGLLHASVDAIVRGLPVSDPPLTTPGAPD